MEQELNTFQKYLSLLPFSSEVRVAMTFRTPIGNQMSDLRVLGTYALKYCVLGQLSEYKK